MTDLLSMLDRLRRPRLLIRAAREGLEEYRRTPHLRRVLGQSRPPVSGEALVRLLEIEDQIDSQRRAGDAGYSLVAHVDVMIAVMAEAQLLRAGLTLRDGSA